MIMTTTVKQTLIIVALVLVLIGALSAWMCTAAYKSGYGSGKASVVVKERVDTVTFAVLVHDTLSKPVPVTITRLVDVPTAAQAAGSPAPATNDTSTCYTWSKTEPDSAVITAKVCSEALPLHITGLQGTVEYVGPTVRTREIFTRDTLQITVPKPTFDWKSTAVTAAVFTALGVVVGVYAKK